MFEFFVAADLGVQITALVVAVGTTATAVALFLKARPEAQKIVVDAAQGAVVVQSGVITSLRDEVADLRAQVKEFRSIEIKVRELEHVNELLMAENTNLKARFQALEGTVERSINGGTKRKGQSKGPVAQ